MSQPALLSSSLMCLPLQASPQSPVRVAAGPLPSRQEERLEALSWLVAFTGTFFLIGMMGMLHFEIPEGITLSGAAGMGASELTAQDTTMAELQAMEEPEMVPDQTEAPDVVEVPEVVEVPVDQLDLPELTEVMTQEDVFTIPAAPRIESALKPVDPAPPKPRSQTITPRPRRSTLLNSAATTTPAATQGSRGGGSGAIGSGGGKGRFPTPPYPSFARSRGIQGSVTLSIHVSPSGTVESAMVASGTGFSELDNYAASWVRRNWRFPAGTARNYRLPISFKLR